MTLLALDVREACKSRLTGKGQWTKGFTNELINRDFDLILYSDSDIPSEWNSRTKNVHIFKAGLSWHLKTKNHLLSNYKDIIYISPTSLIVPYLLGNKIRVIPIIHDLIAFRNEPHNFKAKIIERLLFKKSMKNAFHICTVSESTKSDLNERYKFTSNKSTAIFAGPMSDKVSYRNPDGKTILCIGTLSPRKNQFRLIKAYQALPSDLRDKYKLILVGGRGWNDSKIIKEVERTEGVKWIGHVSNDEYNSLLNTCEILALPSLYEGFGLQVLDALQRGIPVVTSERGSLPEVTGDNAVKVDPENIDSIARGLEEILTNSDLRNQLKLNGPNKAEEFSWKRTVDLFLGSLI